MNGSKQREDGEIANDEQSVDWEIPDPPSLPKARKPEQILSDLINIAASTGNEPEGLELVREQLYAPRVWLRLTDDYHVSFGGPILARGRMEGDDKYYGWNIHSTLVNVVQPAGVKLEKDKNLPGMVFDIGRLYLSENSYGISEDRTYQPTDYRVFLEWSTKAVWLFYEYYRFDSDDSVVRFEYQKDNTLARNTGKNFDSAKILDSVEEWRQGLRTENIRSIIQKNGFESSAYITPALTPSVEDPSKSSRNEPKFLSPFPENRRSKSKKKASASPDEPEPLFSSDRIWSPIGEGVQSTCQLVA